MTSLTAPALEKVLEPVGKALNPEAAQQLLAIRFDAKTQARIDRLARKCNEGKLTPREHSEYEGFVTAIDLVALLQAKARSRLARSASA